MKSGETHDLKCSGESQLSFLTERYLSASLYRPNDSYVRRNECTRRDLCDCRDAREISEEELGVGR